MLPIINMLNYTLFEIFFNWKFANQHIGWTVTNNEVKGKLGSSRKERADNAE